MRMRGLRYVAGLSAMLVVAAGPAAKAEDLSSAQDLPSTRDGIPVPVIDEAFVPDLSVAPATDGKEITGAIEERHQAARADAPPAAMPEPVPAEAAKPPAAETVAAPAPAGPEDSAGADAPKADALAAALGERLVGDLSHLFPDSKDLDAVKLFYAGRGNAPFFAEGKGFSSRAEAALAQVKAAAEEGLEPSAFAPAPLKSDDPAAQAESELRLLSAVLAYARQVSGGRIDPGKVHPLITPEPQRLDPAFVLDSLARADDIRAAMASFAPPQEGYRRLKAKLADIRSSGDKPKLEADIIANMERWRWVPRDMGKVHVLVNIPAYEASIVADGKVVHKTRVIVGKANTPTPVFSENMQYAVINPSWSVPYSIIKKEMLPKAQARGAAAFAGMEVLVRGRVVDPSQIDWSRTSSITVRQPPSERNALGRIKFLFPNRHAVYLHDTPNRSLFANAKRAYSHGCVRVNQPEMFGEVLFRYANPVDNWTEARFRSLYGKGERRVDLKQKIPVHIAYFTLSVDDKGNLVEFDDIYRFNEDTRIALSGQTKTARNGLISP